MGTKETVGRKERFAYLDLLKMICCVFVIGVHTMMNYRIQGDEISYEVLFVESFLHCCVPIFLMVTGFFLFSRDRSVKEVYSYILKKIAAPTIVLLFFLRFFKDFLYGNRDIISLIQAISLEQLKEFVLGLLRWSMPEPNWYLWYITTLVKLYLMYPLVKHLCKDGDKGRNRDRYYIMFVMALAFLVGPTVRRIIPAVEDMIYIEPPISDCIYVYVFIGYEFYRWYHNRNKDKDAFNRILFIAIYILSGLFTFLATKCLALPRGNQFIEIFMANSNVNIMLQSVGLFGFFLLLPSPGKRISRILSELAGSLLGIYLIHYPVILVFINYGIVWRLDTSMSRTIFYPVYIMSVFAVCIIVIWSLRSIGKGFTFLYKKISSIS